jgi:hypothetical protein
MDYRSAKLNAGSGISRGRKRKLWGVMNRKWNIF